MRSTNIYTEENSMIQSLKEMDHAATESQEIIHYNFNGIDFPVMGTINEPLFEGNLVCKILGYSNPRKSIADHVDKDDVTKRDTIDSLGRTQKKSCLTESGLFSLILRSKKTEAKEFKRWVTKELLPSIRKTGGYHQNKAVQISKKPKPLTIRQKATEFKGAMVLAKLVGLDGNQALLGANRAMEANYGVDILSEMGVPKQIPTPDNEVTLTPTALGMALEKQTGEAWSAQRVNKWLFKNNYQYRNGDGNWHPTENTGGNYAVIVDTNKAHSNGTTQQLKWKESILEQIKTHIC